MRLAAVAKSFNKAVCLDGYSGAFAFNGQLYPYDDSERDSESFQRRILSVAPGSTIPPRRVVSCAGTRFILGKENPDVWKNRIIRVGHVAHEATDYASIRTLEQACLNQPGVSVWAGRSWVKDAAFTEQTSNLTPLYHIHVAAGEPLVPKTILAFAGHHHVVRSVIAGATGLTIGLVEQMSEPAIETAIVSTGVYDPVTETTTAGSITITVIRVRWQALFRYDDNIAPSFGPDDIQLVVAKSVLTVRPGMAVTLSDGTWHIASAASEGPVWLCRATRHV